MSKLAREGLTESEPAGRSHPPHRFRSPAQELVLALFRTADRVRRTLGSVVEAQGLTLQQFNVLRILRGAGSEGLPTLTVAERMVEQTPGVTRLLDRLERGGLIHRTGSPRDRRLVLAHITDEGRALLDRVDGPLAGMEEDLVSHLSAADAAALLRGLHALMAAGSATGREDATSSGGPGA